MKNLLFSSSRPSAAAVFLLSGFLAASQIVSLEASRPEQWNTSTQEEFLQGEFNGVAVSGDGKLSAGPALELTLDTGEAFIHSVVADRAGNLYVGTGSNGKIFRIPPGGQGSEWAKLDENGVFGLAVDSMDRIYAATSPGGKVYRLKSGGQSEIFYSPREKFIWALATGPDNSVYVATGPKGIIYKVDPQGNGSVFYDSSETHIVSLAWDLDGNLLAGSAPSGILFRISPNGTAFVIYDSAMDEIKAIATDRYGVVYAAGLSYDNVDKPDATPAAEGQRKPAVTIRVKTEAAKDGDEETVSIEGTRKGKRLEIYRIDKDLLVDTVYSEDSSLAFDLLVRSDGGLLAATSDKGRIVSISPSKTLRLLAQSPDDQVTRLIEVGGAIYAATSNLGKVYRLGGSTASKRVYESEALDAKILSSWGKIRWRTSPEGAAGPAIYTRSGNTSKPDKTWSDWSGPYTEPKGSQTLSPPARYLQWKAEFQASGDAGLSEGNALESVTVSYLQRNMAPRLTKVTVHSAGSAFVKLPTANQLSGVSLGGPDNAHMLSLPQSIRKLDSQTITPPPREVYIPGARSVSWSADDPNDDDLVYSVYYRAQNETEWRLAAKNLTDTFYTMDGASLADGIYYFKVKASDLPSNPPEQALEGELVGKSFVVGNASPQVTLAAPKVQGGEASVEFQVRLDVGVVFQAERSTDGGDWRIVHPKDGIADSASEDYAFTLRDLSPGEHVVSVRVVDSVGNLGAAKATFTVR